MSHHAASSPALMKTNSCTTSIGAFAPVQTNGGFRQSNFWVWGSSVIRASDGRYHMFASRVPRRLPFHPGWMIASEIVRAVSDTPEGPYAFQEVVLPARGSEYWDGRSTFNPKLIRWNNLYVLFYTGSTHPFAEVALNRESELDMPSKWCIVGRSNKRVGVAVSEQIEGPWTRLDQPVLPTQANSFYSFLTSNPSPVVTEDGRIKLIFKARGYQGHQYGEMTIGLAEADDPRGPYRVLHGEPLFSAQRFGVIEDPYLWRDKEGYHLLAKDHRGNITGVEPGVGILAHSPDCLEWTLDQRPLAYTREVTWEDGSTRHWGNMERVSALHDPSGRITHLFFAVWDDPGGYGFGNPTPTATAWNMAVALEHP